MRNLPDNTALPPHRAVARWRGLVPVSGELIRYGVASGLALAVDFATLVLLTELAGLHYLLSAAVGFSAGIAVAYLLSIRWVFSARRLNSVAAETTIFVLIGIAGLAINQLVIYSLTEGGLLPYAASKIAAAGIVFTFNFSVRKLALFTVPATGEGVAS